MGHALFESVAFWGLETLNVEVEVDTTKQENGSLIIVGLPDTAIKESKDRVATALKNSGFPLNDTYCIVNLAPGNLKKEGSLYDLPIALGILASKNTFPTDATKEYVVLGELGLNGGLRPISGALAAALHAKELKKKGIMLPGENLCEVNEIEGLEIIPINSLLEAVSFFQNRGSWILPKSLSKTTTMKKKHFPIDFSDIKGQVLAKRAMEIAASGGHNILLSGPPGAGKTMLAKAFVGIMPSMSAEEILETTKIYSIAGLIPRGEGLVRERPFRSPHHSVSYAGLVGGGANPSPGEICLAHNGVLFLDELPEFSRQTLEMLRQPLEDGKVTLSRAKWHLTFPTKVMCVAAMNPCPCGYSGHPTKACKDTPYQIDRYHSKISGPLLDRFDMVLNLPPVSYADLKEKSTEETSEEVRERVEQSRSQQQTRLGTGRSNSEMTPKEIKQYCTLSDQGEEIVKQCLDKEMLSKRGLNKVLAISRTLADTEHKINIETGHLLEALSLREAILTGGL